MLAMNSAGHSAWMGLFVLGLAVPLYTFVLYPLLVGLWARLAPRPLKAVSGWQPRVAVVVIMHNEAHRVQSKLKTLLEQDYPAQLVQIVAVSDGSSDQTVALLQEIASALPPGRIVIQAHTQRRGKAACLNDAVAASTQEVLVFTDARQALNPQAISALVESLSDPEVGVVSGELEFRREGVKGFGSGVDAYWRYEKLIRKSEAAVHSVPGATGALYAMRRRGFRPIDPRTVLDDVAIPMGACLQGSRVVFDARAQAFDDVAQDARQERSRKVRTLAGNFQLMRLMPDLLLPWRNPIWWQYMSHKVLRLISPWALILLFVSSAVLAPLHAWALCAFVAQALAYGLGGMSQAFRPLQRWRLARLLWAFMALNGYALLGLWAFFSQAQLHQWKVASR